LLHETGADFETVVAFALLREKGQVS
jgi:hypothetical protein